jgi:spoIIIJ-associated protein
VETTEASGKTVEDALNSALTELGATRDQVEIVILDEGQKGGLFGRGSREAQVRVTRLGTAPSDDPPAPSDSGSGSNSSASNGGRPRGARGGRSSSGGGSGRRSSGGGSRRVGLDQREPALREQDFLRAPTFDSPPDDRPAAAPRAARPPRPASGRRESASGDRGRSGGGERRSERRRDDEPAIDPDINAAEVDFAAQVIDDVLRILDIDADINIREPLSHGDGRGSVLAVIDIKGDGLGLLIGRRGDTLIALQYLVNLIVTRQFPGRPGVTIDVEHYRHRREEQIVSLALRMADRVRETGNPITLEPMPPSERRIIHLTLAEDPDLVTNSIGEGENRKVVISAHD